MKKRILAFALTLAMVVTSLSMLSFVSFAEVAPEVDDDANEEISTVLMAGYTAKEPVKVTSSATATATYSLASGNITINVAAADLASVKANIGGYATTATATDGAAVITVAINKVVIYKDATNNAVADLQLTVTTASDETFNGTLVFVTNDATNVLADGRVNTAGAAAVNGTAGVFVGGDSGSENFGKLIYRQAEGQTRTPDCYYANLGKSYASAGIRNLHFDITVTDMKPADVKDVVYSGGLSTPQAYDQINLHMGSNNAPAGLIVFNLVNTTNGGSDGSASLVLAYGNRLEANATTIIPLDKTVGESFNIEFIWDTPTYGCIKIDDEIIFEKDNILSGLNIGHITSHANTPSGFYFRVVRGSTTDTAAFNFDIENLSLGIKSHGHTADRVVAAGAGSTGMASEGSIKLSYVQESNFNTSTATTVGVLNMYGGSGTGATLAVKNTAVRSISQGSFAPLGIFGNHEIEFSLNVAHLNAFDFSNGGTLEGNAKYTENINAAHGPTIGMGGNTAQGIGNDTAAIAHDRLLIGAIAKASKDGNTYVAVVFHVVNDTNDGLVLVHTDFNGSETVLVLDKEVGETISFSLEWNFDNTGVLTVGEKELVFDDLRTVDSKFPNRLADNGPQCYFGGYGTVQNGYFGLNSIWSTANTTEGYVVPEATISNINATTTMPLDVRFVATIDTLDAKEAGFEINLKGSDKVVKAPTTEAYKAITANTAYGVEKIYAPDGKYFVAVTINNVPAEGTVTFVVKPYFTYAGETTYGTAYEVTYVNGVYSGAVAVAN